MADKLGVWKQARCHAVHAHRRQASCRPDVVTDLDDRLQGIKRVENAFALVWQEFNVEAQTGIVQFARTTESRSTPASSSTHARCFMTRTAHASRPRRRPSPKNGTTMLRAPS